MIPNVVLLDHWPAPDAVTPAVVVASRSLVICYGTANDQFAKVTFAVWHDLKMGGPNDEALDGHPLYTFGLKHYSIHRIDNSPWLHELERQNSVHPLHNATSYLKTKVHYLLALKEETIECIVTEREGLIPCVEVFHSRELAVRGVAGALEA